MIPAGCLRIFGVVPGASQQRLAQVIDGFLAKNWSPPRRFAQMTACAFLLTDPGASRIDVAPLAVSASALQRSLASGQGAGPSLLLFEGAMAAVQAFAALDDQALASGLRDPSRLPPGGRLTQVTDISPHTSAPTALASLPATASFAGVYSLDRRGFIGDVLGRTSGGGVHSLVGGAATMPAPDQAAAFDLACLAEGLRMLTTPGHVGVLFFPLSYAGLTDQATGPSYAKLLGAMPADRRNQAAANVYGLPSNVTGRALQWVSATLAGAFAYIDLRITDPDFPVANVKEGAFSSATLVLPDGDAAQRQGVVSRWLTGRAAWRERRLWTALTNLRAPQEIQAASTLQIPFISGPGVSAFAASAFGGRARALLELPA
ncbi:hypothetical protein [Phenylobacterium aquaticum]|uniref:hypothetical protein n=1 Tax=Phenylobacterium aquaticum TaxID=1763816 RepID=UPI0026EDF007|nr:hypothetical protein [Phenylobacterium aquaticum]